MKLYKNGRTILFAIVIIFFIVLLLFSILPELTKSYSLGPNEYIYYDWKYHNESGIVMNAPLEKYGEWSDPGSTTKHIKLIIEINNTNKDIDITIRNLSISSNFTRDGEQFFYSTTTDNYYNYSYINWSCIDIENNITREDCTENLTRIDWGGTFGEEFGTERTITAETIVAIQVEWDMDVNDGGAYNFTFYRDDLGKNNTIDPDISVCSNITSPGYYNITDDLSTTRTCIIIKSSDVILNGQGHSIDFCTVDENCYGIWVQTSLDNISILNFSALHSSSAGAPSPTGIYLDTNSNNLNISDIYCSGGTSSMYYDTCVDSSLNNYVNIFNSSCSFRRAGGSLRFWGSRNIFINNFSSSLSSASAQSGGIFLTNTTNITINNYFLTFAYNNNNNPALYLSSNSSAEVYNSSISYKSSGDTMIQFENNNDKDLNLTNVTLSNTGTALDTSFESDCNGFIHRKWFVESYVNDTLGNAISGANVTIKDVNSNFLNWSLSNSSGYTPRGIYKQYSENATQKYYDTPFTFKGSKSGYPNGTTITNITTNRIIDTTNPVVITLGGDDVNLTQSFSSYLSGGINFSVSSLPAVNLSANGNNGAGVTSYNITITLDEGNADLWIKADGDLDKAGGGSIALVNEKYSYSTTDNTVPSGTKTSLTTSYNKIVGNLASGTTVYLKFYLNVTSGTASGVYNNTLSFLANQTVV